MKTAQLLKDNLPGFNGHAALYKLTPPIRDRGYDEDDATLLVHYVVASAVNSWAVETFLFPANEDGEITSWAELEGSMKGVTSHETVFENIGYIVVPLSLT